MKKNVLIVALLALVIGALVFGGFWYFKDKGLPGGIKVGGSKIKMTQIQNRVITEPIKATAGDKQVKLGDLTTQKVSIEIPKGAFTSSTQIELVTPESVPEYPAAEGQLIGTPIEIKSSEETRLDEKATITFAFDPKELPADTYPDQLMVSYYNGQKWDYIKPKSVDMEKGLITFESYHFSILGVNKVDDETVITEHWIHSKTLDDKLRGGINDTTDEICNKAVEMTLAKMGINDKSVAGKVLSDILTDDTYKEMHDALANKDVLGFNQKLSVLLGKKIAERVPDSLFKSGLESLTEDSGVEYIEAVSQAAGYATDGQYKEAARIIGGKIADEFLITTAGKIAVEIVNSQIESWKNSEVEAAYLAYRNGSSKIFYGYYNDPKDFDTVWSQMRGIGRQLEIEAIAKENDARKTAGLEPLSERQMDVVRNGVKESFRRQFEKRVKEDEDMDAHEKEVRMMVDAFKKAGYLDRSGASLPSGLDKGLDLDNRLDVLYHFAEKVMKDTKRFQLSDKEGLIMADKISVSDIVQASRYYFSGSNGKKDYAKFLKDRFNISLYPELTDLAGKWENGKTVITDVIMSDEMKAAIEKAKEEGKSSEDGCDFSIDFNALKGKEAPVELSITPQGEAGGTMTFGSGKDAKSMPFTYDAGTISASFSDQGAVATLSLNASEEDQGYTIGGSAVIDYQGKLKILASVTASKGKAAPADVK